MKRYSMTLVAVFLGLGVHAQDADPDYPTATIETAIARMRIDPAAEVTLDAANSGYLVTGTSRGARRLLPAATRDYLAVWARSFSQPKSYVDLFASEVSIEENGRRYWMPLKKSLDNAFALEAKDGVKVNLWIRTLGTRMSEPVMVINAFQVQ
jgi:hypothetical protein